MRGWKGEREVLGEIVGGAATAFFSSRCFSVNKRCDDIRCRAFFVKEGFEGLDIGS